MPRMFARRCELGGVPQAAVFALEYLRAVADVYYSRVEGLRERIVES